MDSFATSLRRIEVGAREGPCMCQAVVMGQAAAAAKAAAEAVLTLGSPKKGATYDALQNDTGHPVSIRQCMKDGKWKDGMLKPGGAMDACGHPEKC